MVKGRKEGIEIRKAGGGSERARGAQFIYAGAMGVSESDWHTPPERGAGHASRTSYQHDTWVGRN